MRLLFWVLLLLLLFGLIGFMFTNPETQVPVTFWNTHYPNVHIFSIVLGSVLIGVIFTGIFAIAEGAQTRLENHRLKRQVRNLETELNYLRTQPASSPPASGPAVQSPAPPRPPVATSKQGDPPSAPVYGADGEDWPPESDDDIYSGGRAV